MIQQVSIPNLKYSEEEEEALELVKFLVETENYTILECILEEIINNEVYKQGKNVIGIINDYEYIR